MKIYIYSVILSLAILNLPCVHTSESGEGYISNLADLAESVPAKPSVRAHKKNYVTMKFKNVSMQELLSELKELQQKLCFAKN